jgi:cytochrome b561
VLGVSILLLTGLRLAWRRRTTLPPWAEALSAVERRVAHVTERLLYLLLGAMPLTGLWLVLVSDDVVAVHVASHLAFYAALLVHVGLVLKHQLIHRDRLLRRML